MTSFARLPVAIATLFLAATAALPASAATPTPLSASLHDAAVTPIEAVQHRQAPRKRAVRTYRNGYNAYAAAPRRSYRAYRTPWGHCVSGLDRGARSAFPNWDLC
jgi:hypothetical protein